MHFNGMPFNLVFCGTDGARAALAREYGWRGSILIDATPTPYGVPYRMVYYDL